MPALFLVFLSLMLAFAPAFKSLVFGGALCRFQSTQTTDVRGFKTNVTFEINAKGQQTDYGYDVRNRRISVTSPEEPVAGGSGVFRAVTYTGYDEIGNVVWAQDARGYTTEYTYDGNNRQLSVVAPPVPVYGGTTARPTTTKSYDRNGNVVAVENANGKVTMNAYDALNRLSTTTDGAGVSVFYDYDAVGNRTKVTDGRGVVATYQYDGLRRVVQQTEQNGQTTYFGYNEINKTSRTDALGRVTHYGYDERNRLTGVSYDSAPGESLVYAHDFSGNLTSVRYAGTLALQVDYSYNAQNCVLSETSQGVTHRYGYDKLGNRTWVRYGTLNGTAGREMTSTYDNRQRLSAMLEGARATSYAYDTNGNLLKKTLPDGEVITYTYDGSNRKVSEEDIAPATAGSPASSRYKYVTLYDQVGNLCFSSEVTEQVAPRILIMTYDQADRLSGEYALTDGAASGRSTLYTYDSSNNRTAKLVKPDTGGQPETTTYANALNQLTGLSMSTGHSVSYEYDFNGNRTRRTADGVQEDHGYDQENRLISWQGGSAAYAYGYDYRTRRTARVEGGATTTVVYSGGTSVQEYVGAASTPAVEYVRGSDWGGGVGGMLYSLRGGAPSFAHFNSRGDVVAHTDTTGALTYQASYEADGRRTAEAGSTPDRQHANSKEEDPTGLLNEGMRYRDLEAGVLITRDPAGMVDGPNQYAYVRQNPWSKFDPDGLETSDQLKASKRDLESAYNKQVGDIKGMTGVSADEKKTAIEGLTARYTKAQNAFDQRFHALNALSGDLSKVYGGDFSQLDDSDDKTSKLIDYFGRFENAGMRDIALLELKRQAVGPHEPALWEMQTLAAMSVGTLKNPAVKAAPIVASGVRPPNLAPADAGRTGALREALRQNGVPTSSQPSEILQNVDRRGNPQPGRIYKYTVPAPGGGTKTVTIRDDAAGHYFGPSDPQNRGPHFNDEAGNHYDYKK